ncbi:hypothetical protein NQZ79_g2014 [Umbelopsis isabellina]|nr:hypothetical protein NQZ79_g2014 [Umbelopsis isabellina]
MDSAELGSSEPPIYNAALGDYEQHYLSLLKSIASLQWVRESLPSHTRYYESLKNKLKNEEMTRQLLEDEMQLSRKSNDSTRFKEILSSMKTGSQSDITSYSDLIERLQKCHSRISSLNEQLEQAKDMIIPEPLTDPAYVIEEHTKNEVLSLESYIPQIESRLERCQEAQLKLYNARDAMENAMKSLPGAASILERQAMINNGVGRGGVRLGSLNVLLDMSVSSTKESEAFVEKSIRFVKDAVDLYPDMPMIPDTPISRNETISVVLTSYRGYRLKIESLLRNFINPRVKLMQGDVTYARHSHESKRMEWVEQQLLLLEAVLRSQSRLQGVDIEPDLAAIRMGSHAAAGTASELGGRVAVDDALEVGESSTSPARNGPLPEYHKEQEQGANNETNSVTAGPSRTTVIENVNELPEYSRNISRTDQWSGRSLPSLNATQSAETDESSQYDQPPAYTD